MTGDISESTDTAPPTVRAGQPDWVEIVSAIVLALATIASAWSAYQATRWSGVMSISFSEASSARVQSSQAYTAAGQLTAIDVATFVAWADAVAGEEDELAGFFRERFRPELAVAVDAWLDTSPLTDPEAPPTPFAMEEYAVAERSRGDELVATAEERIITAKEANQTGDNYVLTTVLFASVLFFAGIATKFSGLAVKRGLVAMSLLAFIVGTFFIATFPVH